MTRKPETIAFWVGRLPHWEVMDGRYFVTIHLAGAIPIEGQQQIRRVAGDLERLHASDTSARLRVQRSIFREMEVWLDRVQPADRLHHREVAEMVVEAIEHRIRRGTWRMFEYVVMPSHLHLFFELLSDNLACVLKDFKRWTGHRGCALLEAKQERFWQREWFDHWSRSDEEDERIAAYIRQNPVKASLVQDHRDWQYGSWNAIHR